MAKITSREELEEWFKQHDRADFAQVIAARAALRVLPYAFAKAMPQKWVNNFALDLIRALVIAWAARSFPAHDMTRAAAAASVAYAAPNNVAAPSSSARVVAAAFARFAASEPYTAARVADDAANANANASAAAAAAVAAAVRASDTARAAEATAGAAVWINISRDCEWLASETAATAASGLTHKPLWLAGEPKGWGEARAFADARLDALNQGYSVWIDWYNRRIRGERAAFAIPGDSDRTEDKAILARLADATDKDFWDKGAAHVNTTLQGWIDAARERVRPRDAPFITDPLRQLEAAPEPIPPQNQNAIAFTATESGKIRIDASRNADALRTDADAQDRHGEAIREARALLDRCRLSNSAARFVSGFENYLSAGGETLADLRPSLFVQRGEKLRQEIAAYESGQQDSFLEPIADDLLIDLKGWRSAHNMAVGLDPLLMRLDTAMLGPDAKPALIAPAELHAFVADADKADILDEGVREIVDEAIDLAPAIPDANDRRTVWSVESVQNLVIEAFSVALNHPVKTLAGVAFTATVGVKVAAGVVVGGLATAKFLIKHRVWIETKLNRPTWKSLFDQVCDRLEEWTPFKSSKDDDGV
jgi:hypothetical protein